MPETEAKPFEYKLADGTVVKAENIEEAFKTVAKMKEDTATALRAAREQQESTQAQLANLQTEIENIKRPPAGSDGFSKDRYYQLLNEDPVGAQNYIDAHRFGIDDPSSVPRHFQELDSAVSQIRQQVVAGAFLQQHTDFPQGDSAAKALRQKVESLIQGGGFSLSLDTLNYAYGQCIDEGSIKPIEQDTGKQESAPSPPLTGRGGLDITDTDAAKAENMTDVELEKFLRLKGML